MMKFLFILVRLAVAMASMANFHDLIKCTTNENPFKFNNYGCYCGLGGSGNPIDDIDRCCERHDKCYKTCFAKSCDPLVFSSYSFDCDSKKRTAKSNDTGECSKCAFDCDLKVCLCFRDNLHKFKNNTEDSACKSNPLRNTVSSLQSIPLFQSMDNQLESLYYSISKFFKSIGGKYSPF